MIRLQATLPRLFAEGPGELQLRLELAAGSLTAVVGPSGSGKTTLLRLLAGRETPLTGEIRVDDDCWLDTQQRINRRPQERSVGYIFQDAALFPNLSVRENIRFVTPRGQDTLADQLIEATGLGPFAQQKPALLSGGQRQRVALARALVRRPRLLLLDEPFAALDPPAADALRQLVGDLHRAWGTTTVLVSHHEADVRALADRVVQLANGQIVSDQVPPRDRPAAERIRHIFFDEATQEWVVETETMQLRSRNPQWSQFRVGMTMDLRWQ